MELRLEPRSVGRPGARARPRRRGDIALPREQGRLSERRRPLGLAEALRAAAALAATTGRFETAARLYGGAEARHQLAGVPLPPAGRAAHERAVEEVRTALGGAAFEAAWSTGRSLPLDDALADALDTAAEPAAGAITPPVPVSGYPANLTEREVEVLRLIAAGLSNAEVGRRLYISPRTVNSHLTRIYDKLDVSSRSAATRFAYEHGLGGGLPRPS